MVYCLFYMWINSSSWNGDDGTSYHVGNHGIICIILCLLALALVFLQQWNHLQSILLLILFWTLLLLVTNCLIHLRMKICDLLAILPFHLHFLVYSLVFYMAFYHHSGGHHFYPHLFHHDLFFNLSFRLWDSLI